jgi:hypothetical protein
MSDSTGDRAEARPERNAASGEPATPGAVFQVVASGENVVMINVHTGQTWAMTTDGTRAIWHPVEFGGLASRAPLRSAPPRRAE